MTSYGVSSYGYDLRGADEFKIFTNVNTRLSPEAFRRAFVCDGERRCRDRAAEFVCAGVLTICAGKSTYARCGIIVNVTPFEPEWEGFVTLEISNTTPLPAKIYAKDLCQ